MACNGSVSWSQFSLVGDVFYVSVVKVPAGAPDPRKTRAEQEKGLLEAAEEDAYKQSESERYCPRECQESRAVETKRTDFPATSVVYEWREEYEGLDAEGKPARYTAKYTAVGRATFLKRTLTKECAPNRFGNVAYDLEGFGEVTIEARLLGRLPFEELHGVLLKNGLLDPAEPPVEPA